MFKYCAIIVLSLGFASNSLAMLDIELTQGVSGALPIAVVPFSGQDHNASATDDISKVIQTDLANSGQFSVKDAGTYPASPNQAADVQVNAWRKIGATDVIVGSVSHDGIDSYKVTMQLVNVYNDASQNVLATVTQSIKKKDYRRYAHHLSDVIFKKLTGTDGVFSTKIAYILVKNQLGLNQKAGPQYTLEVADADGFNPKPLLVSHQPIMSPAWSPDGNSIAYVSFEGNKSSIYLQDIASGQRRILTQFPGINGAPAFSPDGSKLALVLTRTGNPKIFLLDLSTNQLTQLTQGYSIDTEPAWAPDGKSLAFTSNRGGSPQIYRYTLSGGKIDRLTFDGNYNARASFSPDGTGLVMMHREKGGMFGIAYENLGSEQITPLTQTGLDESPSLAPNGKMILYDTQYSGRGVLAEISVDGRVKVLLPSPDGDVQVPAWSPYHG